MNILNLLELCTEYGTFHVRLLYFSGSKAMQFGGEELGVHISTSSRVVLAYQGKLVSLDIEIASEMDFAQV